jgi:hypothetical protein
MMINPLEEEEAGQNKIAGVSTPAIGVFMKLALVGRGKLLLGNIAQGLGIG